MDASDVSAEGDGRKLSITSSPQGNALFAAFVASLHSPKATLLCKPRPRDFEVDDLRLGVADIVAASVPASGNSQDYNNQDYLSTTSQSISAQLNESLRRWKVVPIQAAEDALQKCGARVAISWEQVMGAGPDVILEHSPAAASDVRKSSQEMVLAFHGAPFENIWSILNHGFVNAAQVAGALGRHGQARSLFGKGIYLSKDPAYAATFVRPSLPLPHDLGRWRCLLICEVVPGPMVTVGGTERHEDRAGWAPKEACDVPDHVIVVEDSDAVTVRFAFFWRQPASSFSSISAEALMAIVVLISAVLYFLWFRRFR